jgi:hypothetical protein
LSNVRRTFQENKIKQTKFILWEGIHNNPPPNLKISPIVLIPHKSRAYYAIPDLSFCIHLSCIQHLPLVNKTTALTLATGAIDQMGHSLSCRIHDFKAEPEAAIFMAKFDINRWFCYLDCTKGREWNFASTLPWPLGQPPWLVVPASLQMGWTTHFCTSKSGWDVASQFQNCHSIWSHHMTFFLI